MSLNVGRALGYPREKRVVGELHLLRRRLDLTLQELAYLVQTAEDDEPWQRAEQAARLAARGLTAAVAAAPPLPAQKPVPAELIVNRLRIDTQARRQWWAGREFSLTPLRHLLLVTLAAEPDRVFYRDELQRLVWADHAGVQGRTVDTAIAKLRRDLAAAGAPLGSILVGQRGLGWALTRPEPRRWRPELLAGGAP